MELYDIFIYGVSALVCLILAALLKGNRQAVLQYATDLINRAETAIQGSGMGADKKALVIAQLQAAGIRVSSWLDHEIDVIVATLNKSGAWLATKTQESISGLDQSEDDPHE